MKNDTRRQTTRDDDEDDHFDDAKDLDWPELASLYMQTYDDEEEEPDFSILGYYARDSRCEREKTWHRRY